MPDLVLNVSLCGSINGKWKTVNGDTELTVSYISISSEKRRLYKHVDPDSSEQNVAPPGTEDNKKNRKAVKKRLAAWGCTGASKAKKSLDSAESSEVKLEKDMELSDPVVGSKVSCGEEVQQMEELGPVKVEKQVPMMEQPVSQVGNRETDHEYETLDDAGVMLCENDNQAVQLLHVGEGDHLQNGHPGCATVERGPRLLGPAGLAAVGDTQLPRQHGTTAEGHIQLLNRPGPVALAELDTKLPREPGHNAERDSQLPVDPGPAAEGVGDTQLPILPGHTAEGNRQLLMQPGPLAELDTQQGTQPVPTDVGDCLLIEQCGPLKEDNQGIKRGGDPETIEAEQTVDDEEKAGDKIQIVNDSSDDVSSSDGDETTESEIESESDGSVVAIDENSDISGYDFSSGSTYVDDEANDPDWGSNPESVSDVDSIWGDDVESGKEKVLCKFCDDLTSTDHTVRHRNAVGCQYCNFKVDEAIRKDFSRCLSVMGEHRRENHPNHYTKYLCDECGQSYAVRSSLTEHYATAHNRSTFDRKCTQCDEIFESNRSRSRHILKCHPERLPCTVAGCEKIFPNSSQRSHHVRLAHLKVKNYSCSYEGCTVKFFCRGKLKKHVDEKHLQLRKFQCDFEDCGKVFLNAYTMKVHQRIHSDEKPLKCPHCDYAARQRNAMNWHMRKHARPSSEEAGTSQNVSGEPKAKREGKKSAKPKLVVKVGSCKDSGEPIAKRRCGNKSVKP
jgi:uncharacterized C2H2 Zn-finger protein